MMNYTQLLAKRRSDTLQAAIELKDYWIETKGNVYTKAYELAEAYGIKQHDILDMYQEVML